MDSSFVSISSDPTNFNEPTYYSYDASGVQINISGYSIAPTLCQFVYSCISISAASSLGDMSCTDLTLDTTSGQISFQSNDPSLIKPDSYIITMRLTAGATTPSTTADAPITLILVNPCALTAGTHSFPTETIEYGLGSESI